MITFHNIPNGEVMALKVDLDCEERDALDQAVKNGHALGQKFSTRVRFCTKCNSILTYLDVQKHMRIGGLFGGKCNGTSV